MRRFAISPEPPHRPLVDALRSRLAAVDTACDELPPDEVEWRLLEDQCDAGLVSPLAYAQRESELVVLPGAGVAAYGPTEDVLLRFNSNLHRISSVAVPGRMDIDALIGEVILREKYRMTPAFVRTTGDAASALDRYDAVVVRGAADAGGAPRERALDLVDEWYDMTQLPFVRLVVAARETAVDGALAAAVQEAGFRADAVAVSGLAARMEGQLSPDALHLIPGHHRFAHDDAAIDGLEAFFRFAFYHGLHRDIPLFRLWTPDSGSSP